MAGSAGWRSVHFYKGPPQLKPEHKSQSQAGQDFVVLSILGCKRGGFYVDLAANDYKIISNSFLLDTEFGWQGICIEANPMYFNGQVQRTCTYVIAAMGSPKDKKVTFVMDREFGGIKAPTFDNADKGGSHNMVDKYLVPINEVMLNSRAPKRIDYFSLDVEGAESWVMNGFDWAGFRFTLMTVERPKADLKALLTKNGYKYIRTLATFDDELWMDSQHADYDRVSREWAANVKPETLGETSCLKAMGFDVPKFY